MAFCTVSRGGRFPRGQEWTKRHGPLPEVGPEALRSLTVRGRLERRQVGRTAPAEADSEETRSRRRVSRGGQLRDDRSARVDSRSRDEDPPRRRYRRLEDLQGVVVTGGLKERRARCRGLRSGRSGAASTGGKRSPDPSPSSPGMPPRATRGRATVPRASGRRPAAERGGPSSRPSVRREARHWRRGWCVRRASGPTRLPRGAGRRRLSRSSPRRETTAPPAAAPRGVATTACRGPRA